MSEDKKENKSKPLLTKSLAEYNDALLEADSVRKSIGSAVGRTFESWDTNISIRSDMHRGDYEYYRPSETIPHTHSDIMDVCDKAYEQIGIVRHIIDLMAEFAVSGIRLQHTDRSIEQFYSVWFEKVDGLSISERFLNYLYRLGNNIIQRHYGTISVQDRKDWRQAKSKVDDVKLSTPKTFKRQIPLDYSFFYPGIVEVLNKDDAIVTGKYIYGLKLPSSIYKDSISRNYTYRQSTRVDKINPKVDQLVRQAIKSGKKMVELDPDKIAVYHYKKDDWQLWSKPIIYSVLKDLIMYDKLKLADVSALDGVISNVRLWTLGFINESHPAQSVLPTATGIAKLRGILHRNIGGGVMDLVWGPDLKFQESATDAYKWLGTAKYEPTINAIYDGLGIPAVLRSGGGATSSGEVIGLQTLIERLEYGRAVLVAFWMNEIRLVHKAMGFTSVLPAVMFDQMILADRAAERQLLINLADRDIISSETVNEAFGRKPEIEAARIKREFNRRGNQVPEKASPYHTADKEHEYKKLFIQGGNVTASEIGLELQDKKKGEKNRIELTGDVQTKVNKAKPAPTNLSTVPKGQPQQGRPRNVTETKKRKPKPDVKRAKSFMDIMLWASNAQEQISEIVSPAILHAYNKKNLRSLSRVEFDKLETVKFNILCNLKPHSEVNSELLAKLITANAIDEIGDIYKILRAQFVESNNRDPNLAENHQMHASAYTFYYMEEEDGDD